MRVLQVIPSISERTGGPGQAILPMCRGLVQRGVEVLLATTDHNLTGGAEAANLPLGEQTDYRGVTVAFFPCQIGTSFKYSRPFSKWLDKHVAEFDVVHIHAVFNHSCIAAARACRKRRVPYIVRPLGTLVPWSMQQKSFRKRLFWHAAIRRMLTKAAAIHYTTEGEKQSVESSLNLRRGVVIPLGVEVAASSSTQQQSDSDHEPVNPYVLVLSRLHPKKAVDVLLEAFLSLVTREEFQRWRLVLAGDGPAKYVAALERRVAENLAADFVNFTGWLEGETKVVALRGASLLALPSHHENFGLCVMESLACGVPVLISPNVNLAPEVSRAEAGWISAVNALELEQTLAEALSSADERKRRGANGRALAEKYSWPRIAAMLEEVYAGVIEARAELAATKPSSREAAAG